MDKISEAQRADNMRAIRSKDTSPEMVVRRMLTNMGCRYRLHVKDIPGKPDIVFRRARKAILVHGCFWHQHPHAECADARRPRSNESYWEPKLTRNVERDRLNAVALNSLGWQSLVIWECELRDAARVRGQIRAFLGFRESSV